MHRLPLNGFKTGFDLQIHTDVHDGVPLYNQGGAASHSLMNLILAFFFLINNRPKRLLKRATLPLENVFLFTGIKWMRLRRDI